jgi:NAD(P)-dependent dehydrogenase (short-subunit alcohol dehydrogenase family)
VGRLGKFWIWCSSLIIFTALFLASPAASYVAGAHMILDGGGLISGSSRARL